jgi:threonine dehydrogenase-like Zn-dependent dehydrogenase
MWREFRTAAIDAPGRIKIHSARRPEPGENEVLVRLEGCGICGSNLPVWEGRPWFSYPLAAGAPGHEGWGIVEKTGPSVESVRPGSRVAVLSQHAFAEYDTAPASHVIELPPPLNGVPFPGEALGCAMNVLSRCDVTAGQKVAVIGVGFLGALLVQLLARQGAVVYAISRRASALAAARRMGAAEMIPMVEHQEVMDAVRSLTDGDGCERVIEATGHQWPLDLAGELTAERGKLIVAGYHQDGPRQVDMRLWNWKGIDVVNAHERAPRRYLDGMRKAVSAVASGCMDPSSLYTHRFALDELNSGLDAMRARRDDFMKGLVIL